MDYLTGDSDDMDKKDEKESLSEVMSVMNVEDETDVEDRTDALNVNIAATDETGEPSEIIASKSLKVNSPPDETTCDMDASKDHRDTTNLRKNEIIDILVKNKKAHFKSQQRGEPDLSLAEKRDIADCLFKKSPSGFLSRYGDLLSKKHLDYFLTFQYPSPEEKEEATYLLSHLGAFHCKSSKTIVKNRRYDALQKMINSGSYFLMEEMQARNPLLYEQLVGQYQTEEEKQPEKDDIPPMDGEFLPWTKYFAEKVEKERIEKLKLQQELDEASDGYDDSSDEKSKPQENEDFPCNSVSLWGEYRGKYHSENSKAARKKKKSCKKEDSARARNCQEASQEEKALYLQEFQAAMYHSFLSGNDKDFDYSTVDNNPEYDCVDMRERDEQDQYFDDESPTAGSAEMDITDDDQGGQSSGSVVNNSDAASSVSLAEDDTEDMDQVCDRLTEDDVNNLRSFASSWAKDISRRQSEFLTRRDLRTKSDLVVNVRKKNTTVSPPKIPVKKNHKIKITLKTKEI